MKIINQTKHTTLAIECKIAVSTADRLLGLLKKNQPPCLLFFTRWGIHTFFLKSPIDVLVLDRNHRIVKIASRLRPYRFLFYNPLHKIVIELPSGTINATNTALGDKILLA